MRKETNKNAVALHSTGNPHETEALGRTPLGVLPLRAGKWHRVRIIDTLKSVAPCMSSPRRTDEPLSAQRDEW